MSTDQFAALKSMLSTSKVQPTAKAPTAPVVTTPSPTKTPGPSPERNTRQFMLLMLAASVLAGLAMYYKYFKSVPDDSNAQKHMKENGPTKEQIDELKRAAAAANAQRQAEPAKPQPSNNKPFVRFEEVDDEDDEPPRKPRSASNRKKKPPPPQESSSDEEDIDPVPEPPRRSKRKRRKAAAENRDPNFQPVDQSTKKDEDSPDPPPPDQPASGQN